MKSSDRGSCLEGNFSEFFLALFYGYSVIKVTVKVFRMTECGIL